MSTRFYYQETSIKPLTLHAKDELFLDRGCKAQRIQFHRRGIVTAGCFSSDPQKSEFIESHNEIFHENIYIFWVLLTNFDLASQRQKLTAISDHTYFFAGTGLVLYRRISNEPSLNITAIELLENSYIQLLSNGPALKFRTCRIRDRLMIRENVFVLSPADKFCSRDPMTEIASDRRLCTLFCLYLHSNHSPNPKWAGFEHPRNPGHGARAFSIHHFSFN